MPYHLVERVLADPTEAALALQKSEGTAMFIDLVGFTGLTEEIARGGPAALSGLARLLDQLFTRMHVEAFFPFRGEVVEFAGDAMTVVFRKGDFAQAAAAAAIIAQRIVSQEAATSTHPLVRKLQARVGLSTGHIYLAVVGDLARRLSVATGAAVHQAIALQTQAAPGQCIIDEATASRLVDARLTRLDGSTLSLEGLDVMPLPQPLEPLGRRLDSHQAEKIALLEPFVPGPLARRLRTTPSGWRIETEVRQAVVVFAQITGFMTRSAAHLDASLLMSRSLLRAFQKYDGLVLKVMATATGHQAMVLFGVHRPTDNDDEKAVLASLEAITRLSSFRTADSELTMQVGIHRGGVLFGAVGSDSKHDLTAIGDAVNVAARVAKQAKPLEVVVSEPVHASVASVMTSTPMGLVWVKGKAEPLPLHVVHGVGGGHAHYARRREVQRFSAGRDQVQASISRITEEALNGHASLLGLIGPSGTGKSHLLSNLVDRWIGAGGRAVIGRCQFASQAAPMAPVRQFFEAFLGIGPSEGESQRVSRLREKLAEHGVGSEATELISFLQPIRRPDGVDETLTDFSDPQARERLLASVVAFADKRFDQRILYVLEDLHFADTLTLELVRRLAKLNRKRPYLMVVTARPEPLTAEVRQSLHHELELGTLSLKPSNELVCHELRATSADPELMNFLWRRTEGNPEYLVQTIRFLADRFLIRVHDGVVTTGNTGAVALDEVVPPTWAQVALARLDGLTEIERRVLRTASAIGFSFTEPVLEETELSLSPDTIRTAVEALETQQLVVPDPAQPRGYSFRDEITRSMAYSVIPESERKQMHARIAVALQHMTTGWAGLAATIAHHYERADRFSEAAQWFERVIAQTLRAGLAREHAMFSERLAEVQRRLRALKG